MSRRATLGVAGAIIAAAVAGAGTMLAQTPGAPSAESPPVVLYAVGDADAGARGRRLARLVRGALPARLLYLGDVYERGTAAEFRRGYDPIYGPLARITSPTPGNHEWARRHEGYLPYWRRKLGRPQPPWYAFSAGGWRLLVLNSQATHGPGSAQLRWLRGQLVAAGDCRIAVWHRPRYSAGLTHGDQRDLAPLWGALQGRARLVVSGHEHNLQRLRERDGLVQLISGAGGHSRYGLDRRDRRLAFGRAGLEGAVKLELAPALARVTFRAADGRALDTSEVTCRPG